MPDAAGAASTAHAALAAARPSDAELRALSARVLERPEFAQYRSTASDAELAVLRWLRDWFEGVPALHDGSPVLYWSIVGGLSLVALLLIAHVVYTIRLAVRASAASPDGASPAAAPDDPRARAEALARDGHYLAAARVLQLASVQMLVERGHLDLRRHEPNRVLCARIARATSLSSSLRGDLVEQIREVERTWFRDRAERIGLYQDSRRTLARVEGLARVGRAA